MAYFEKTTFQTPEMEAYFRIRGALDTLKYIQKHDGKKLSNTGYELLKLEIRNLTAIKKINEKSLIKDGQLLKPMK